MWLSLSWFLVPKPTPYVTLTRTNENLDHKYDSRVVLELSDGEMIESSPSEMLEYIRYIQRYGTVQPRTYWCEFPFYVIISRARQKFCLGYRPEDLDYIDTITQNALRDHQAYLNRLARFPLDKAEYYLRLREAHGKNTLRGLSEVTGEDWSYIARILRTLSLPEPIKGFLRSHKHNPAILSFFHLRGKKVTDTFSSPSLPAGNKPDTKD